MTPSTRGLGYDPDTFREDWIEGLTGAYARTVRRVPDAYGVIDRHAPRAGSVAVVIGGGSGHYPAFAGLVGPGLASAAAVGEVFASPSAEQIYRTARAADGGAGILLACGNYSGDVMHFGLAARRLAAEGIESRFVVVTDDVASGRPPAGEGPVDPSLDRRGVAGGFFVFKVAGAAAERGDDLDTVAGLAARANSMTRTFGAAFAGCTLPGAAEPLFEVADGTMEWGMGIHGEPGLRTGPRSGPRGVADALVDRLLPELPLSGGSDRVAVLLNGLGATKGEQLFACYAQVARRLAEAGLRPYLPEVGEYVTSFDMAGISLSLMALDDELAELYGAPCDTPAYRLAPGTDAERGPVPRQPPRAGSAAAAEDTGPGTADAAPAAEDGPVTRLLRAALDSVREHEEHLGRLDAVAGDGDHGRGIVRGLGAAVARARETETAPLGTDSAGRTLLAAGLALADASGGASGALYGALLTETGATLTRAARTGTTRITVSLLADAADAAMEAVSALGGARVGDKTMLDALGPFSAELRVHAGADGDGSPGAAWRAAAAAATRGAEASADLKPVRGRAARMGSLGHGHPDAGATSLALVLTAIGAAPVHREPAAR
ncbi:dihydroxyacetone kinase family protein [Streptomyces sp. NPDC002176]|uniref:dihydroxyacetone kinase family protein n=1 Tax=Streptomyces sp. NPDC002176 TaxID=3364634 RepID=UPI00384DD0A6